MKTIYTDSYGVMPWAMAAVALGNFATAYRARENADGNGFGIALAVGIFFALVAGKRFWDVRQAKVAGRDPKIVRTTHD